MKSLFNAYAACQVNGFISGNNGSGLSYAQNGEPVKADATSKAKSESFLEQEVSLPYGPSQIRKNIISSISTVRADDIRSYNTSSLGNMLYGQLSGL